VLGGAAGVCLTGPGLISIGVIPALNYGLVQGALAAIAGFTSSGYVANRYFTDDSDGNYDLTLKWITMELFKVYKVKMKTANPKKLEEVEDHLNNDTIYSNEVALLEMFDKKEGLKNFKDSGIGHCTEESQSNILKRIECIEIVHEIRCILATQCFIGVIGLQDSGKTTLINKIWGFVGKTGLFEHTEVPVLYQINRKIHVIDFPGNNSLDYYGKTFSICGAMSNLIIVVVPFTGDISEIVSKEVANVYEVMAGSESCRVIICINKCGYHLQELKAEKKSIDFLKERFSSKLNKHFIQGNNDEKECKIEVKKEHLLITDWNVTEEGKEFGIENVESVKEIIKNYLVELNIINKNHTTELQSAVSPPTTTTTTTTKTTTTTEVKKEHLLITDWNVTEEEKEFGIENVEIVNEIIKNYLS